MHDLPAEDQLREPPFQGMRSPSLDNLDKDDYYYLEVSNESDHSTDYFVVQVKRKNREEVKLKKLFSWVADTWIRTPERHSRKTITPDEVGDAYVFREPQAGGARRTRKAKKSRATRKARRGARGASKH